MRTYQNHKFKHMKRRDDFAPSHPNPQRLCSHLVSADHFSPRRSSLRGVVRWHSALCVNAIHTNFRAVLADGVWEPPLFLTRPESSGGPIHHKSVVVLRWHTEIRAPACRPFMKRILVIASVQVLRGLPVLVTSVDGCRNAWHSTSSMGSAVHGKTTN